MKEVRTSGSTCVCESKNLQILEDQHECSTCICCSSKMDEQVLNKMWNISNKRYGGKVSNKHLPQHYCRHCHVQRHQNGLLAFPFSHMVGFFMFFIFFIAHILQGMESTCSSHPSSYSHFWHLLMQRSTTKASKSFRFSSLQRSDGLVFDLLVLFRASFQPRRGSTCSSTFMAIPSR